MQNPLRKYLKILPVVMVVAGWILVSSIPAQAESLSIAIIDSGAKGFVDEGISFTSYPASRDPLDHGTEVARLIRKCFPQAKLFMLQVCDKVDGVLIPSKDAVLEAISWSVAHHVDIVNMSLVIRYDKEIAQAIEAAARDHGIIFVAAVGNKSLASRFAATPEGYMKKVTRNVHPAFPSSSPYVIAVGAYDEYSRIADYSVKYCDLYENGKILGQQGTSFACARVTSRVAKILSQESIPRTKETILARLVSSKR